MADPRNLRTETLLSPNERVSADAEQDARRYFNALKHGLETVIRNETILGVVKNCIDEQSGKRPIME